MVNYHDFSLFKNTLISWDNQILNFLLNQKINAPKYCINPKRFLHLHHKSILFKKNCFYKDERRDRLYETRATNPTSGKRCQFLPNFIWKYKNNVIMTFPRSVSGNFSFRFSLLRTQSSISISMYCCCGCC